MGFPPESKLASPGGSFIGLCTAGQAVAVGAKPVADDTQELAFIMNMPIDEEERFKLLHASQLPRDKQFLRAILHLVNAPEQPWEARKALLVCTDVATLPVSQ